MSNFKYRWYAIGDINAFFGLMLDNLAGLIMVVSILSGFGVPTEFVIKHIIPGTAIGVLVGDLIYFVMALMLAKRTGKQSVTAMPLGLDTPSIFGMTIFVLGPAFLKARETMEVNEAAMYMWHIGICCLFLSGIFKGLCSFFAQWIRDLFPRAGLLGSLAAIALVLISFLPLLDVMKEPIVGLVAMALILFGLIGNVPLPGKIPGVVGALILAGSIHFILQYFGWSRFESEATVATTWLPSEWTSVFTFSWFDRMGEALKYLPVVLPFTIATVIGGIDCTESAAAAGDNYSTGPIVGVEAFATLVASLCGGVIQTTPYIGHPAYKAMGGRAAYALATAFFIGAAGVFGFFGILYHFLPQAAVYPILIFVGLEITAQSFLATPKRHYPAVALACVPALAVLSLHFANQILGDKSVGPVSLSNPQLKHGLETATLLANGFIITSLLWASALALAIDRRLWAAAGVFLTCAVFAFFGIIHSPLPDNSVFIPFSIPGIAESFVLPSSLQPLTIRLLVAYLLTAFVLMLWGFYLKRINMYGVLPNETQDHVA